MKFGVEVADMVGPPGKGKKYKKPDDAEEMSESADDESTEVSEAEEYQDTFKNGSPEEFLKAFKKMMDLCG